MLTKRTPAAIWCRAIASEILVTIIVLAYSLGIYGLTPNGQCCRCSMTVPVAARRSVLV